MLLQAPILIRGRHGVGKSQTVYQFADSLGLPVIERHASQMTEGDLLDCPTKLVFRRWPQGYLQPACVVYGGLHQARRSLLMKLTVQPPKSAGALSYR